MSKAAISRGHVPILPQHECPEHDKYDKHQTTCDDITHAYHITNPYMRTRTHAITNRTSSLFILTIALPSHESRVQMVDHRVKRDQANL